MATRHYRLRIRAADGLTDSLVLTSVSGGTNPYIVGTPQADGTEVDVLTGEASAGGCTVRVQDVITSGTTRVLTSQLADANGRTQLVSRKAFVEESTDGGTGWSGYVAGYVTAIRLADALTYEIEVGEVSRAEQIARPWATVSSTFPGAYCFVGGPVRGGFGPLTDYGGWEMTGVEFGGSGSGVVQLHFRQGWVFVPDNPGEPDIGRWVKVQGELPGATALNRINALARPHGILIDDYTAMGIEARFDGLKAAIVDPATGNTLGEADILGSFQTDDLFTGADIYDYGIEMVVAVATGYAAIYVEWPSGLTVPTGDTFHIYVYPTAVSDEHPLYVEGHPITLATGLLDVAGIAYDSASATSVKASLGPLWMELEITDPPTIQGANQGMLLGPFGVILRTNDDGEREFKLARVKGAAAPAETIEMADLYDEGQVYEVSERSVVTKVIVSQKRFRLARVSSRLDSVTETVEAENGDAGAATGDKEIRFDIPGTISYADGSSLRLTDFVRGIAEEVFDRYGRGGIEGPEVRVGPDITADIGDEVYANLDHMPNGNVRGGNRIVQVVRRTPVPEGALLKWADSGVNAQPVAAPTFTFAISASRPRSFATGTLTNAATLAAEGSTVRVEIGTGATEPTEWALLATIDPDTTTTITTPRMDAGTKVWMRMRAVLPGKRPSAWATALSVTLTGLTAPGSLNGTSVTSSQHALDWTLTDTDVPVWVYLRLDAESDLRKVAILPPGSTRYTLTGLTASTDYVAAVEMRELPPAYGASSQASIAFTAGSSTETLPPPQSPRCYAGNASSGGLIEPDGTVGFECAATVIPSAVVLEMAVETAIASGTAGSYTMVDAIPSVQGGMTRWSGRVPSDGKRRYFKAHHSRTGDTDSDDTDVVSIDPWNPEEPAIEVPTDLSLTAQKDGTLASGTAYVRAAFTAPTSSFYSHMRYRYRAKPAGGSYPDFFANFDGTASGPDLIPVQFNTVVEITPQTVALSGATRDGVAVEVSIPDNPAAEVTVSAVIAQSTQLSYPWSMDDDTVRVDVYRDVYAGGVGAPASAYDIATAPDRMPDFVLDRRFGTSGTLDIPIAGSTDIVLSTWVPYDRNVQAGVVVNARDTGSASTAPDPPTLAAFGTPTATTIPVDVTVPNPLGTAANIQLLRNGVVVETDAIVVAAGAVQTITETGLTPSTNYGAYSARTSTSGGVPSSTVAPSPAYATTAAGSTLPTPVSVSADRRFEWISDNPPDILPGHKEYYVDLSWSPGASTPSGTKYKVYKAETSGGAKTEVSPSGGVSGTSWTYNDSTNADQDFWYIVATKSGYTDSAFSTEAADL